MIPNTETDSPIKAVHALSTGIGEQHREHRFGTRLPLMWWVLTSRSWVKVPINAYALEHRDGLVLFDTGLDPAIVMDPGYITDLLLRDQMPGIGDFKQLRASFAKVCGRRAALPGLVNPPRPRPGRGRGNQAREGGWQATSGMAASRA